MALGCFKQHLHLELKLQRVLWYLCAACKGGHRTTEHLISCRREEGDEEEKRGGKGTRKNICKDVRRAGHVAPEELHKAKNLSCRLSATWSARSWPARWGSTSPAQDLGWCLLTVETLGPSRQPPMYWRSQKKSSLQRLPLLMHRSELVCIVT